jgi:5-methyltetrahydrofolate--homocysteine methyltransferase
MGYYRGGLKVVQGKSVVNSISLKEGEEQFIHHAKLIKRYCCCNYHGFDEVGQADTTVGRNLPTYDILVTKWVFLHRILFSI